MTVLQSHLSLHQVCLSALLWLAAGASHGAVLLQTDNFQDATTQGWTSGPINPNPPVPAPDSGPLGVGDFSLLIRASGAGGAGGKLVAFNRGEWTGDYIAAGITAITADVLNPNPFDLVVRAAMQGPGGQFSSSAGVMVSPGSGWQSITLHISPGDLISVGGFDVNTTLSHVTELRILHNPLPSFLGASVAGTMFLDNITAVPEPSLILLFGLGPAGWIWMRRFGQRP